MKVLGFVPLLAFAHALYSPDDNDDWTILKPESMPLPGSYLSLPFKFGLIPSPYTNRNENEMVMSKASMEVGADYEASRLAGADVSVAGAEMQPADNANESEKSKRQLGETDAASDLKSHSLQNKNLILKRDVDEESEEVKAQLLNSVVPVACVSDSVLLLTLNDGILRLAGDRIGSIVSSHQFQFDGPTPQHGALYAAGWLVTAEGVLALGESTLFYRCTSGEFYKLYNKFIGSQCKPVQLEVIELIMC